MAKFLMIQLQPAPYPGTAYLNGAAVSRGHDFVLFLHTNDKIENVYRKIEEFRPSLIGFSCMTGFHIKALSVARQIKSKFSIPIIMGGPHATLFPDVIHQEGLDIICRGEGEFALIDLLDAIDKGQSYADIQNLWVKIGNGIRQNELRPLVDPLDNVPLIDWSCYKGTVVQNTSPSAFLIRGCPYLCTYCFNHTMREMYKGRGKYIRHFSVERSIKEIKRALEVFKPNFFIFASDTFGIDPSWMDDLFSKYQEVTTLPFVLLLRPELTTEEVVRILAKYRCHTVGIGVESGSERVRKQVLARNYSNELLLEVSERLHKAGVRVRTFNMIGLPTETEDEIWETIDLNVKMQADFPRGAIFMPFPNTKIVEIAKASGQLPEGFSFDDIPNSILKTTVLAGVNRDRIKNLLHFFQTGVLFPWLRPLIRHLVKIRPNPVFLLWFYGVYGYVQRRSEGRNLLSYLWYVFANRKDL